MSSTPAAARVYAAKYLKIEAAVRSRPDDVEAWLNSRPTGGGQ